MPRQINHLPVLAIIVIALVTMNATHADDRFPEVETSIGVGLAAGMQTYDSGGSNGTSGAVQITYRALIENDWDGRWLFELGFEHARSLSKPEIPDEGRDRQITSNGIFYRQSWVSQGGFYVGGRLGIARVRGTREKRGELDIVVGLQGGYRFTDRFEAGIEAVVAEPSLGDGIKPGDLRGVVTVSF
ncbi:hypothetical protein M0534_11560 [Methylonatrum kenyense]|uniref:hypothetical protein n=1 Tax=Methylonatrum kenyense TaxID=455253 RepID=UPI0020BFF3CA|nr:hypothetical protein [Methylonatrum kenyense]MCK8516956.1 hypothetical protein [Methylonatrum kenyense]